MFQRRKASSTATTTSTPPPPPPQKKKESVEYEFGGPLGALATTVTLPLVVVVLGVACDGEYCVGLDAIAGLFPHLAETRLVGARAFCIVIGWIGFQAVLQLLLPGRRALGAKLATGDRLEYLLNGHLAFWVSLLAVSQMPLAGLYDDFPELAVAACFVSIFLAVCLYAASFRRPTPLLAQPGTTGSPLYDFFMGRELNPRIGPLDLKCFCELRPGLIGWLVLDLGCCAKRRQLRGSVGLPLALVTLFQGLYVWDALYFEKSILTTMDITTDGFGLMLAFGDLAWVPFTYSLQARFLVDHDANISTLLLLAILALQFGGYFVFRGANSQKDLFRSDFRRAEQRGIRWIETASGRKLIISGFWGAARKINYTGDWLMSLAWCLLTGFNSPIPYFYCTYFAVLLVHRAMRDDHACARKYGDDWPKYKALVPYVFIPRLV
ncbi:hypothetical protein CTAYLR_000402 [Chrysophaeum taylorii]|uniref:Delta(14)-sterol reductase n=1 Tax=Chrysophaeum taylorii TaxID=2483200 RepID=A0AAD7UIE8_9STRA|nr:hypothetical protein CTAYLR_000402 [Chrysophaeum taylorii]